MTQSPLVGAILVASVSLVAALFSLAIGLLSWRLSHRTYSASRETRLEDLYDRLMDYRLKHPEVLVLSRKWQPECLTMVYSQRNPEEREWAIYMGYVELCISYCNAVLHARHQRQLDRTVYTSQHEPLIRLLLTEHYPIIRQLTREGGFVSSRISGFIEETSRRKGWDWEAEYRQLDQVR
ncbi:MAG: hypothetical protein RLZ98_972 [Pseudomonadota bacterium]|jgi:hypothetical protein